MCFSEYAVNRAVGGSVDAVVGARILCGFVEYKRSWRRPAERPFNLANNKKHSIDPSLSIKHQFPPNKYKRKPTAKMLKLAVLFTLELSALTSLVVASNCKNGIEYCGYNLLNKGERKQTEGAVWTLQPLKRVFQG